MIPKQDVWIDYTNHRGERAWRHVQPLSWFFGTTEWHPVHQWLMIALDVEKNKHRSFAMKDIHEWRTERVAG